MALTYTKEVGWHESFAFKKEFFPFEYDTHIYAYDYRGLTKGTLKSNHLAGYNLEHISYNFNGQPLKDTWSGLICMALQIPI